MQILIAIFTALGLISPKNTDSIYLPTIYPTIGYAFIQIATPTTVFSFPPYNPPLEQSMITSTPIFAIDSPELYNPWMDIPTISYMDTPSAQNTGVPLNNENSPIPDYMQYIGTPVPGVLTPKSPMFVINLDDIDNFDIDNAWDMIATPGNLSGNALPLCPSPLPIPFVDQSMAVEASLLDTSNSETIELQAADISRIMARGGGYFPSSGIVTRPENGLLFELMTYDMSICQDGNGIAVYGVGVQIFLNDLAIKYLH